ncbi:MAG: double-strand break repair helicase AddA [Alphaproteobacteria bacterium]|nr:double-strand break repair helicase AddA [Alphaproteobacteria bacterium]
MIKGLSLPQNTVPDLEHYRAEDPNVLQRRASDPGVSVWVGASAGTGKTKVLTDRVLRLLLPRADGSPGAAPHKILCLTFTKAGAGEMALRVSETLARWAVMPETGDTEAEGTEKTLRKELRQLLGHDAGAAEITAARRLFADVIDTPGGLKIMTIHAFCQSVLARFPLEAEINPHFVVLEESQSSALLAAAQSRVLKQAQDDKASLLSESLQNVAEAINGDQFFLILKSVVQERRNLQRYMAGDQDFDRFYTNLCAVLNVLPGRHPDILLQDFCDIGAMAAEKLRDAAKVMLQHGGKTDNAAAQYILDWLAAEKTERMDLFSAYKKVFLTNNNELRQKLVSKPVSLKNPDIPEILLREAELVLALLEAMNAARTALLTRDLFRLCGAILIVYQDLKAERGGLDFSDLVLRTLDLLQNAMAGGGADWVQYKLDHGLEHMLIDEAQDTNPEQWQIIEALCAEFFAGHGAGDIARTVFTVGDEKQSIYSFQRASPEEFARMKKDFAAKVGAAGRAWQSVPMNISFRSTRSVLEAVDAVFAQDVARKGLGDVPVQHHAFRRQQAGLVELWPLFKTQGADETDLWDPHAAPEETDSGAQQLSLHIAQRVKKWLDTREVLPAHGRAIRPGDIMILVRTRGALVNRIAQALKNMNIPVSGLDRMVLGEQIAVQDALAAMAFVLQPQDDLNLACLLKSPFIGMDEETLYTMSIEREGKSLWEAVQARAPVDLRQYLERLKTRGCKAGPFAFLSDLLQEPCPGDEMSGRRAMAGRLGHDCMDSLDELINIAIAFERDNNASLQHFIQAQQKSEIEIKREQEGGRDEVRIMTVHGSKGLQAPIVILPDTTSLASAPGKPEKRLLWPKQGARVLPLWSPRKDMDCKVFREALAVLDGRVEEEYRRLLYVAMTRAEDRLYIAGAEGKNAAPGNCWYNLVKTGLEQLKGVEKDGDVLRLSNWQEGPPDQKPRAEESAIVKEPLPEWLMRAAAQEPQNKSIVRPSYSDEAALSPLAGAENKRFLRGNLTHKLLQVLPDIPVPRRRDVAQEYLARYGQALEEVAREDVVIEVLKILEHSDFADIFGAGSLAEVPITGQIEGRGLVSGQIDRLLVREKEILIIDFKTNRPPPQDLKNIPPVYRAQMEIYAEVLRRIYPDRPVRAALLWTDGPFLMEIPFPEKTRESAA